MCTQLLSHVWLFVTLWNRAHQALLSLGFSRQEYWSGLPFHPPGDLSDPGLNLCLLRLLHCRKDSLPLSHVGSPNWRAFISIKYLIRNNFDFQYCDAPVSVRLFFFMVIPFLFFEKLLYHFFIVVALFYIPPMIHKGSYPLQYLLFSVLFCFNGGLINDCGNIRVISYDTCLCLWLTSLGMIISGFIHVTTNGIILFFLMAE